MRALLLIVLGVLASARLAPAQVCPDGTPPPCRATARRAAPLPAPGSPQRPYTIVAEFDGTAPGDVRAAAKNLVISALEESGVIAALPDEQVQLGLTLAGKPETTRVDVATARELAVRGAVRTVMTGTIDQVGQTYHAAVRVLDADSNRVVTTRRDIARGEDDLIPTLDRVVRAVRVDLGEHRQVIAAYRPLEQAATPSFAAYQRYRLGRDLNLDGDYLAAQAAYREALALDPSFAMAWRARSTIYWNMGFNDSALFAADEALTHPDRLTEGQRLNIEGWRARILGDVPRAFALQERALRLAGGIPWLLCEALLVQGRVAEAVDRIEQWERATPFGLRPLNQSSVAVWMLPLGRIDEARRRAASVPGTWGAWARLRVAMWTAHWPAVESLATSLMGNPVMRESSFGGRAMVAAVRGEVRQALELLGQCDCWRQQLVLRLVSGLPGTAVRPGAGSSDTTAAGRLLAGLWDVVSGDTASARQELATVRSLPPGRKLRLDDEEVLLEAWLAGAAGRDADVVRLLRPLAARGTPQGPSLTQPVRWLLAAAYQREGHLDSAAVQLERLAAWQGASANDVIMRGFTHSFAHQRLAVLYAQLGRRADARRHWQAFSTTFTQPDPEMQHFVDEAHAALASAEARR